MTARSRYTVYNVINTVGTEHRNAAPGETDNGTCEVCEQPVRYIPPSRRKQEPTIGRFCSSACMGQAKRLPPELRGDTATELPCMRCKVTKPVGDFWKRSATARGYQTWCKACTRQARSERERTPEDPKLTRKYKLKEAYGITLEDYDAMYQRQDGRCAICGDVKEPWEPGAGVGGRKRFLVVDHDHETSQVRSLLCWNCNCGLGQFREDPRIMLAAAAYAKQWSTPCVVPYVPLASSALGQRSVASSLHWRSRPRSLHP